MKIKHYISYVGMFVLMWQQQYVISSFTSEFIEKSGRTEQEFREALIKQSSDGAYIDIRASRSRLSEILDMVSSLDTEENSPIWQLKRYMQEGNSIALKDSILYALDYAFTVIEKQDNDKAMRIGGMLDRLASDIQDEKLTIYHKRGRPCNESCCDAPQPLDSTTSEVFTQGIIFEDNVDIQGNTHLLGPLYVKNKASFCDESKFCKKAQFHTVEFKDGVNFDEQVIFKEGITVEGTAHINELVVKKCSNTLCIENLSVTESLIISGTIIKNFASVVDVDVSGTLSVNDVVVGNTRSCNLCQNGEINGTLSANDEIVTNSTIINLSVTDETVENSMITNLFVNDEIIMNATITNLSVVNCFESLCINNLSALDGNVSGTLSVNNIVAESNLPLCIRQFCHNAQVNGTLSVNDEIVTNATIINLSVIDEVIDTPTVINLSVINCVESLCVNDLSVVDVDVSGTLSVNDIVVGSPCTFNFCHNLEVNGTLSVNNEMVTNATITNLSVINCIESLCINNVSVVDVLTVSGILSVADIVLQNGEINGTLSANDEIVTNATITNLSTTDFTQLNINIGCDLTVGCNISMVASTDPDHGNVIKAGVPFIHTFPAGFDNTFVGENAGNFTTGVNGVDNTAVGFAALSIADTAASTAIGTNALQNNQGFAVNTAIGANALPSIQARTNNTAVGVNISLLNENDANTIIGADSGPSAPGFNPDLGGTTVIGFNSGTNKALAGAVAIGANALRSGSFTNATSTAVGEGALQHSTGVQNTAVGMNALNSSGFSNQSVAIGQNALFGAGNFCVAVGQNTLFSNIGGNFGGIDNTALGQNVMFFNTTGPVNTVIGQNALFSNTTGGSHTVVGQNALSNMTTGSSNIAFGINAGNNYTSSESNNIVIGNGGVVGESGAIRIGDVPQSAAHLCFIQGIFGATTGLVGTTVLVDANGQLGTISSSRNVKDDIYEIGIESASIYDLNPVTFVYKSDASTMKQYGLIAEEVDQVLPSIVIKDQEGQPFTVQYHVLPVLLLNEMIKQHEKIEEENMRIIERQIKIEQLEKRNNVIVDIRNRLIALEQTN